MDNYRNNRINELDKSDINEVNDEYGTSVENGDINEFGEEIVPEYVIPDSPDEQAATDDGVNYPDGEYDMPVDEDTESGEDNGIEYNETYDYADPDAEQAATIDEWYTTSDRRTEKAQERCELDDYEIISDVLGSEKQLVKLYTTALCEASEEPLRNIFKSHIDSAANDQYKAFEFMQQRGMYKTEQASEEVISEAKQQFGPLCNNCNCHTVPNPSCSADKVVCTECGCDNVSHDNDCDECSISTEKVVCTECGCDNDCGNDGCGC